MLRRWLPWIGAGALFALYCVLFHGKRMDDAYITYRYGQNLATGYGPVFNPGQRLMGSTSPGHVLLSALLHALVGHAALPSGMACVGCLGWILEALAVFFLLRPRLGEEAAAWAGVAVGVGASFGNAYVCMETNLVAACVLWALVAAEQGRWMAVAVLAACAGLLRADSYLFVLLLGVSGILELRSRALRPAALFLALTLPWYAFAAFFYGSVLPQSAITKFHRAELGDYAAHVFQYPASGMWSVDAPLAVQLAVWVAMIVGALLCVRCGGRLWLLPAWAALHTLAYLYLRPFTEHSWHMRPLGVVGAVLVLVSLASAMRLQQPRWIPWLSRGTAAAWVVALGLRTVRDAETFSTDYWVGGRDRVYREAASYMRSLAKPGDVVGAIEVGTLAYYSDLPMYDWGGLVTPEPVARPEHVQLRFAVLDPLYTRMLAPDLVPVRLMSAEGFDAYVYDFALVERALREYPQRADVQKSYWQFPALNIRFAEFTQQLERERAPDAPGVVPHGRPDIMPGRR